MSQFNIHTGGGVFAAVAAAAVFAVSSYFLSVGIQSESITITYAPPERMGDGHQLRFERRVKNAGAKKVTYWTEPLIEKTPRAQGTDSPPPKRKRRYYDSERGIRLLCDDDFVCTVFPPGT